MTSLWELNQGRTCSCVSGAVEANSLGQQKTNDATQSKMWHIQIESAAPETSFSKKSPSKGIPFLESTYT